ncbi:hypothetical protein CTheo_2408 [Ceratobasidium theobromae]|uniref:Transmembrane protein n=1 Tax=Ceratobasidium theobromae TaxID=1582974 RepID=A0A5N5QR03_9AGAM|nr:hypothetical protein CTheo_2408 [Ceratobasidium theobromae]
MPYHHYSFAFTSNSQGGGSRLFWFLLGGLAATAWIKIRERRKLSCKTPRALPPPGLFTSSDGARFHDRLAQMNVETSEAALDVADATLDAALRIVGALKETLGEQRVKAEQTRSQTRVVRQQTSSGPVLRSHSPSLAASFHHVEDEN